MGNSKVKFKDCDACGGSGFPRDKFDKNNLKPCTRCEGAGKLCSKGHPKKYDEGCRECAPEKHKDRFKDTARPPDAIK